MIASEELHANKGQKHQTWVQYGFAQNKWWKIFYCLPTSQNTASNLSWGLIHLKVYLFAPDINELKAIKLPGYVKSNSTMYLHDIIVTERQMSPTFPKEIAMFKSAP